MRTISKLAAVAATASVCGALLTAPAQAATEYPAVTGCSFTGLYSTNNGGQLSDLQYYYPRNTELTVTSGDSTAWWVTVNRNGRQGWMEGDCVLFLA